MTTKQVTPPAALAVSLADAKLSLREDGTDKDILITAWIQGITAFAEHYTGRSFAPRPMRVTLDKFPMVDGGPGAICLDGSPIASVESVAFLDAAGVQQTLDPADYIIDFESEPGWIVPAPGLDWPATFDRIGAVTVNYTAGAEIPHALRLYVLAKLSEEFDKPDAKRGTIGPSFIDNLLNCLKVYG